MQMNRRHVIAGSVAALVGTRLGAHAAASPDIHKMVVINSLGEPDDSYAPKAKTEAGVEPFITDAGLLAARQSGVTAFNYTITSGTDFAETIAGLDRGDAFIAAHPDQLIKVLTSDDILRAKAAGKVGIIYGFQNAGMVGQDAANVDLFADRGVRIIQLTYNALNQLGGGSLAPGNVGLTPFGRQVVDRLNARRLMVDLSHSGRQICLDAARYSKQPVCISHTGCRAVADSPRNKTDEELRLVAERGGYVGIYFMPFIAPGRRFTSADIAAHIEHAINICGEDHVGIGTDHGVTSLGDMAELRAHYAEMVRARQAKGISAPGENPDLLPYADDLIGPDQFRVMADVLAQRGHSAKRIEKLMGGNFLSYSRQIWAA